MASRKLGKFLNLSPFFITREQWTILAWFSYTKNALGLVINNFHHIPSSYIIIIVKGTYGKR